jgi:hypothetical protein
MEKNIHAEETEKVSPVSVTSSSSSSITTHSEAALPPTDDDNNPPPATSLGEGVTVVAFEPNDPANPHNWSTVSPFPFPLPPFP